MAAPIFKFKNIKVRLNTTSPTFVYGVVPFDTNIGNRTLDSGVLVNEVSTVVLTVQASNITGLVGLTVPAPATQSILVTAYVQNSAVQPVTFDINNSRLLVNNYPVIANNAFDPLSGNLVLSANDQLWIRANVANACDITVSLLEIANATAS